MSPSMLVCADRHESFRDSDLFAVVAVLEYFLDRGEVDAALKATIAEWRDALGQSGPGTVDFNLDAIGADPSLQGRLASALMYAAARGESQWRDMVPISVLNRFDPFQVRFSSYAVSDMKEALLRLHRLLGESG